MVDLGQLQKEYAKTKRDVKNRRNATKRAWDTYKRANSLQNIDEAHLDYLSKELERETYALTNG